MRAVLHLSMEPKGRAFTLRCGLELPTGATSWFASDTGSCADGLALALGDQIADHLRMQGIREILVKPSSNGLPVPRKALATFYVPLQFFERSENEAGTQ